MPLCYGGGVKTSEQVERLVSLGVEKVSISSAAIQNPQLISEIAQRVGNQSIVIAMDIKKTGLNYKYELFTHNGTHATGLDPIDFASQVESLGVGEILINSIDNDGLMSGYDLELVQRVRSAVSIPISVLGGAGSLDDIKGLIRRFGIIGAAAGSLFVFKGKYKAVLMQYPSRIEKDLIFSDINMK